MGTSLYELERYEAALPAFAAVVARAAAERSGLGLQGPLRVPAEVVRGGRSSTCSRPARWVSARTRTSRLSCATTPRILLARVRAVRVRAAAAHRVRRRGQRQPEGDRGDGHRRAEDPVAAGGRAREPARAGAARRPRRLFHGGPAAGAGAAGVRGARRHATRDAPNTHYAYGVYLLREEPDRAIEEFKKELQLSPGHVAAHAADRVRVHQALRLGVGAGRGRSRP